MNGIQQIIAIILAAIAFVAGLLFIVVMSPFRFLAWATGTQAAIGAHLDRLQRWANK